MISEKHLILNSLGGTSEPPPKALTVQLNKPSMDNRVRVEKTPSLEVKIRIRLCKDQAHGLRIPNFMLSKRFMGHIVGPRFPERVCFFELLAREM